MSDTPFIDSASTSWTQLADGIDRQILSYGPDLMIVRVRFQPGAAGAMHHHPHRQATYVARGSFEVTVGDAVKTLSEGDTFFADANVPHGVKALEGGLLIDCFTPMRADFL